MNIVDRMIEFRKTRESDILGLLPLFEPESLTVIVTEILAWLKLERKREIWQEQGKKIMTIDWRVGLSNLIPAIIGLFFCGCYDGKEPGRI